jgi:hypothetical protein
MHKHKITQQTRNKIDQKNVRFLVAYKREKRSCAGRKKPEEERVIPQAKKTQILCCNQ